MAKKKAKKPATKKSSLPKKPQGWRITKSAFVVYEDNDGKLLEPQGENFVPHKGLKSINAYRFKDWQLGGAGFEVTDKGKSGAYWRYDIQPVDEDEPLGPSMG